MDKYNLSIVLNKLIDMLNFKNVKIMNNIYYKKFDLEFIIEPTLNIHCFDLYYDNIKYVISICSIDCYEFNLEFNRIKKCNDRKFMDYIESELGIPSLYMSQKRWREQEEMINNFCEKVYNYIYSNHVAIDRLNICDDVKSVIKEYTY